MSFSITKALIYTILLTLIAVGSASTSALAQGAKVGPNTLQEVSFSDLKDGRALVKAYFRATITAPPAVVTEQSPPLVHLIFDNAVYEGKEMISHANMGPLRSVKVVQVDENKIKITLYLREAASHTLRIERDQFIIVLDPAQKVEVKTQKKKLVKTRNIIRTPRRKGSRKGAPESSGIDLEKVTGSRLILYKGDVQILKTGDIVQVAIGDSSIVSVSLQETGELLLIGEKAGDTMLRLWHSDGSEENLSISVTAKNTETVVNHAAALLSGIEGVTVRHLGDLIVVEGDISPEAKEQVGKIASALPGLVDLTREAEVPMKMMINMSIKLVEFNTSALENLGVDWQDQIAGPQAATVGDLITNDIYRPDTATISGATLPWRVDPMRSYLGIVTSITSMINLAAQNGDAYILASPNLSTRSGGEASFHSGGEVPLPSTSSTGETSVEYKDYGILVTIKPVADNRGNVRSTIETEMSTIDWSVAVNEIPGFLTRKTAAEINVKSGETMVISGLINNESSRNANNVPFFSKIPVLGWLFKSEQWSAKKSELVIFVTPTIVDPGSEEVKRELERVKKIREGFEVMVNDGIVY